MGNKIQDLTDDLKVKFLDDFADAGEKVLELLNKNEYLLKEWKDIVDDDYKAAFLSMLDAVSKKSRQAINGSSKIFKALPEEVKAAAERIKTHRKKVNNLTQGNYGYLSGSVNGQVVDDRMWRSSKVEKTEPQIFTAIDVTGENGKTWLRNTDSEYKMLNDLAAKLGAEKGKIYNNIKGELKIISENPYCSSCQGIIEEFSTMFPNIKLIKIDGAK